MKRIQFFLDLGEAHGLSFEQKRTHVDVSSQIQFISNQTLCLPYASTISAALSPLNLLSS